MVLVYILYDSIHHTIFAGQVWARLLKFLAQNSYQKIILISFEPHILILNYQNPKIKIIQLTRTAYFGKFSLFLNFFKLVKQLPRTNYHLMARGPFAGYLALKVAQLLPNKPQKITIQARGLAGAEYTYTHTPDISGWIAYMLIKIRAWQLTSLEKLVYGHPQIQLNQKISIECVSSALKNYLIISFKAHPASLIIAQDDRPACFSATQVANLRKRLRLRFKISQDASVYCYSGSNQAWQCPSQTIRFFKNKLAQNAQAFLLILTNQPDFFEKLIQASQISQQNYLVLSVAHHEIYQYLAMADYGLLFREKHILNWVARPTKALEYASVHLPIIHNHTIAWLANKKNPARI